LVAVRVTHATWTWPNEVEKPPKAAMRRGAKRGANGAMEASIFVTFNREEYPWGCGAVWGWGVGGGA
jgi:hypothetical protein